MVSSDLAVTFAAFLEQPFVVGSYRVEPRANTVTMAERIVLVEPKVMRVLVCLAAAHGDVVPRADLHALVWSGAVVSDNVLTRAVSEVRKVLGDTPRAPHYVETIPTIGYRLLAPVEVLTTSPEIGLDDVGGDALMPPIEVVPHLSVDPGLSRRKAMFWAMGCVMLTLVVWAALVGRREDSRNPTAMPKAVPLTASPGHEIQPALSPDGSLVAYVWKGEANDNWDIYVQQPSTDMPLRRTMHTGDDVRPAWSPDGTQLAFRRYSGTMCSIMVMNALAGAGRELAPCSGIEAPNRVFWAPQLAWSPDGQWLAYASRTSPAEPISIYRLSLETLSEEKVTHPDTSNFGDIQPAYAFHGEHLAFVRFRGRGQGEVYVVSLHDGAERPLTSDSRSLRGHAWTPDGNHIVFSSDRGGTFDLWRVPLRGGVPEWVPVSGWNIKAPAFAANGALAYENWRYDTNVWYTRLDTDTLVTERRMASTWWDEQPQLSPDGTQLAFISNRTGRYGLWVSDADGREAQSLITLDDAVVQAPAWSPDGEQLAFEVRRRGVGQIHILSIADGKSISLGDLTEDQAQPFWSSDGTTVYYARRTGATDWQIMQHHLATDAVTPITRHGGYAGYAADRQVLYVAKHDRPGLFRLDTATGMEEVMIPNLAVGDWGNWAVLPDRIVFLERQPSGAALVKTYHFADALTTVLTRLPNPPPLHQKGLTVTPDGHGLFYTQLDQTESDIMYQAPPP